jgi:hypothetical protein
LLLFSARLSELSFGGMMADSFMELEPGIDKVSEVFLLENTIE